ncbi:hypothetical protein JCM10213v2_007213 [Rhodosporidiobolus nylandii]
MPSSSSEHVPTASSPLHLDTAHVRQRSLGSRQRTNTGSESPSSSYGHWGSQPPTSHSAVYMAAPDSGRYGHFDSPMGSPRSSVGTLPFGRSPFRDSSPSLAPSSTQAKYGLLEDATLYNGAAYEKEDDDALHNPGANFAQKVGHSHYIQEKRGFRGSGANAMGILNIGSVVLLMLGIVFLFAGWPIMNWAEQTFGYNTQVSYFDDGSIVSNMPNISTRTGPIDPDTPTSAYTKTGEDGTEMQLVFSDEFNTDGRLFYPGMDPYWEATEDLEWYEPDNVGTKDGYLYLELTKETNASSHGLGYLGGMLQSWNKLCWTGGRIEVKLSLPGDTEVTGLWPAVWMMGNLGRAGYGASLEGMWPYSYDFCDVGTLHNQTNPKTGEPKFTAAMGDQYHYDDFNYLIGQRLSRCTCPGDDHPGPKDGKEYIGRSAVRDRDFPSRPEIDIFEATVNGDGTGNVSQSAQWAPFNPYYYFTKNDSTDYVEFFDNDALTSHNTYLGGVYQQVTSGLSNTKLDSYNQTDTDKFAMYGVEYRPTALNGYGTGEIYWLQNDEKMWYLNDQAMSANEFAQVSNRSVTNEPLYNILNLGMSPSFQYVNLEELVFPATMRVDYVRVYQDPQHINIGCDPKDMPTAQYIADHLPAYHNANYTVWETYQIENNKITPRNRLIDTC